MSDYLQSGVLCEQRGSEQTVVKLFVSQLYFIKVVPSFIPAFGNPEKKYKYPSTIFIFFSELTTLLAIV